MILTVVILFGSGVAVAYAPYDRVEVRVVCKGKEAADRFVEATKSLAAFTTFVAQMVSDPELKCAVAPQNFTVTLKKYYKSFVDYEGTKGVVWELLEGEEVYSFLKVSEPLVL